MKDIKALTKGIRNIIILRRRRKKRQPIGAGQRPEFILHRNPKSPVAEAYRMLRTNIQYLGATGKLRLLIVTSSGPREGKTTTVLNLGSAFAQANKRTLIVDSDLRNPSFHRLFNLNNDLGLTNVIAGQNRIDDVIHKDVLMPNLNVLTSGPKSKTPAEIIGSKNTADFMNTVKAAYDIIIFDSPPVLAVTDAQLLSVNADGVILVVQASKIAREVAKKARESLESVKANIIGVVLNNLDMSREHYYYYHKYYYSYPYPKGALSGEGRREEALLELKPEIRGSQRRKISLYRSHLTMTPGRLIPEQRIT